MIMISMELAGTVILLVTFVLFVIASLTVEDYERGEDDDATG